MRYDLGMRLTFLTILFLLAQIATAADTELPAPVRPALLSRVTAHIASLPPSRVRAMLEHSLTFLGVPYLWGADDPEADGGFDCAGFAFHLFHAAGLEFPKARFSTLNMTDAPRGAVIKSVWWTAYAQDFAQDMKACVGPGFQDGDVVVYHARDAEGRIVDRTGHAVIVADARQGYAISAARSGIRLHALGDLYRYGNRSITACWRAPSAGEPAYLRAALTWDIAAKSGKGTLASPFVVANPLDLTLSIRGPGARDLTLDVTGRVLAFISAVHPKVVTLASDDPDLRRVRLLHDFRAEDLPVDSGERIPTPNRKIVVRLLDERGFIAGEKAFYVRLAPYW